MNIKYVRILFTLWCILIIPYKLNAFNPLGWLLGGGKGPTLDLSKRQTEISDVKAGINDNKTAIEGLSRNQVSLKDVESLVSAKITGYDKSMRAGRDVINIKRNDATMIMYIFGGIISFMGLLLTTETGVITLLIRSIFKRQSELDKAQKELDMTRLHRDNLRKSKDFYKEKYMRPNGTVVMDKLIKDIKGEQDEKVD